jgi:hypothetical protein
MHALIRTLSGGLALVLCLATAGASAQSQQPRRPVAPVSPFVGTWNINVAKSTYEGIPENQRRTISTRTIDVEGDGVFVQTHRNTSAVRAQSFSHWVGKPDGPPITEYSRLNGIEPGNRLTIKTVNDHQWQVTFRNQRGEVSLTDTWTVSADGKTLTIDRRGTSQDGTPNHSVEVYDNESYSMPVR